METNEIGRYTKSFGLSLAVTSLFSALLVVAKESSKPLLAWMAKVTGHHWATHGLIAVVLFFVLGFAFAQSQGAQGPKMAPERLIATIVSAIVLSGLIIAGFYLIGD